MSACLACLRPTTAPSGYHERCLRGLFGTRQMPAIDLDLARLHIVALAMVGKTSLSGVQRKVSLGVSVDRATLHVAAERGRYILKPQATTFPALPENEHLTMCLAERVGIEVPPRALLRLTDGTLAYLVRRFDRKDDGSKRRLEDFCQLAEKSPKEKYDGSTELCVRLVRRFATEPLVELAKLFRRMVFTYWTGNGDMHLKNFSLLAGDDGAERLSPAYDLLCTELVIPGDPLALPIDGKKSGITRRRLLDLADYCELPRRAAERALGELIDAESDAHAMVERSQLPDAMKARYRELLAERARVLTGP